MRETLRSTSGRLDVAAFLERQRDGALSGGAQAELVGGALSVPGLPSAAEVAAVIGLALRLEQAPSLRYTIQLRPPLHLDAEHLLRPDLVLLEDRSRFGSSTTFEPSQVGLAVEVVRGVGTHGQRLPALARGHVREVWLLDLEEGWAEAYRSPAGGRYHSRTLWYPGEALAPLVAPDWPVTLLEPG